MPKYGRDCLFKVYTPFIKNIFTLVYKYDYKLPLKCSSRNMFHITCLAYDDFFYYLFGNYTDSICADIRIAC